MAASKTDAAPPLTVLVVDDEQILIRSCKHVLEQDGYSVLTAARGKEGIALLRTHRPDVVLTDLKLPDVDGMELLREVKRLDASVPVIMITGYATVDSSIEAIRAGAYDYIPKPFTATQLQVLVGRAANQARLARDNERLRDELREQYGLENVIGRSTAMQRLVDLVLRVAPTDASIFIAGESGTGKELIARAIHVKSRRSDGPFVAVNCAAFPEQLLESELFGHEKGAFTGADGRKRGLLEAAAGGTFFLDEISEMSQELQAKLLRVLQERQIRRVGGEREIPVDIRVVAATNRNAAEAVQNGLLREDLYFRLNVVPINVPPLRERRDDVPLLAHHFLRRYAEQYGRDADHPLRLSTDALGRLVAYDWPGNVRELQNLMERLVSLAVPGEEVGVDALPDDMRMADGSAAPLLPAPPGLGFHEAKTRAVEAFERHYLAALLARHDGNISGAAREAGIDRKTIHRLLKKHGLSARRMALSAD